MKHKHIFLALKYHQNKIDQKFSSDGIFSWKHFMFTVDNRLKFFKIWLLLLLLETNEDGMIAFQKNTEIPSPIIKTAIETQIFDKNSWRWIWVSNDQFALHKIELTWLYETWNGVLILKYCKLTWICVTLLIIYISTWVQHPHQSVHSESGQYLIILMDIIPAQSNYYSYRSCFPWVSKGPNESITHKQQFSYLDMEELVVVVEVGRSKWVVFITWMETASPLSSRGISCKWTGMSTL